MGQAFARAAARRRPSSCSSSTARAGRDGELVARGARRSARLASALVERGRLPDVARRRRRARRRALRRCTESSRTRGGRLLVEMSTVSVAASRRSRRAPPRRPASTYLRAPFSGNPGAVRAGTAAIFVSGDRATSPRSSRCCRAIAPTVRYVGEGERGARRQAVLQILIGGTAELLAEALVLGEAAGVERRRSSTSIGASVVGSRFVTYKSEPLLRDDYTATFTTAMMEKDVDLVLDLAERGRRRAAARPASCAALLDAAARQRPRGRGLHGAVAASSRSGRRRPRPTRER